MKTIFNKYKFPLRLSDLGNQEDSKNYEDFNHIIDANGIEILGTSEWLRVDDEDAKDIVDILNEYKQLKEEHDKALEQIGQMQLEMYTKEQVIKLLNNYRHFAQSDNLSIEMMEKWIQDNL